MHKYQEVDVDISGMAYEPSVAELQMRDVPAIARSYVRDGTAAAAIGMLENDQGRFHDAVQWRAGPFSGFAIGSYALAKLVIPPAEAQTGLDLAPGREYKAVTDSIGVPEPHRGEATPGLASMPANEQWSELRSFWRERLRPIDRDATQARFAQLFEEMKLPDGSTDLKGLAYATSIDHIVHTSFGVQLSAPELQTLVSTGTAQERDTTEGFTTFFMYQPGFTAHAKRYAQLKEASFDIFRDHVFSGENEAGNRLLDITGGSEEDAATQVLHVILGARGLANSIYWGANEIYSQPHVLEQLRQAGDEQDFEDIAQHAISRYPGAWINTRSPERELRVNLMNGSDREAQLVAGRFGKVVISAYMWGQNPGIDERTRRQASFGVGRRRCPGEKISLGVAPALLETLVKDYDVDFPAVSLSGHGFSLSPRPNAHVAMEQAKVTV